MSTKLWYNEFVNDWMWALPLGNGRIGAMQYTNDLMAQAESIIGHTLDSYTTKYDGLVNSLRECYDIVRANRAELEIPDKSARGMEAEFGIDLIEE